MGVDTEPALEEDPALDGARPVEEETAAVGLTGAGNETEAGGEPATETVSVPDEGTPPGAVTDTEAGLGKDTGPDP